MTSAGRTLRALDRPPSRLFPLDLWYVAGMAGELTDKPLARTLLNHALVLFRTSSGQVAALEDRCCHRSLPLSNGTVEAAGVRCGYHGMLYGPDGTCLEIPGTGAHPAQGQGGILDCARKG